VLKTGKPDPLPLRAWHQGDPHPAGFEAKFKDPSRSASCCSFGRKDGLLGHVPILTLSTPNHVPRGRKYRSRLLPREVSRHDFALADRLDAKRDVPPCSLPEQRRSTCCRSSPRSEAPGCARAIGLIPLRDSSIDCLCQRRDTSGLWTRCVQQRPQRNLDTVLCASPANLVALTTQAFVAPSPCAWNPGSSACVHAVPEADGRTRPGEAKSS